MSKTKEEEEEGSKRLVAQALSDGAEAMSIERPTFRFVGWYTSVSHNRELESFKTLDACPFISLFTCFFIPYIKYTIYLK